MIAAVLLMLAGSCAARDLSAGTVLAAADLTEISCTGGVPANDVLGATLARGVAKGVALRSSLVARAVVVRRADRLAIVEGGEGFEVESSAAALSDGAVGEMILAGSDDRRHPRRVRIEGEGLARRVD